MCGVTLAVLSAVATVVALEARWGAESARGSVLSSAKMSGASSACGSGAASASGSGVASAGTMAQRSA
jgi:hypothetical protein